MGSRDPQCAVAAWTEWSPCSASCGAGYRIRTRIYLQPFVPDRVCDIRLTQKSDCRAEACWNSDDYYDQNDSPPRLPGMQVEEASSSTPAPGPAVRQSFCTAQPDPGVCRASKLQWFYNATQASCSTFTYTGCAGNKNNFASEAECLAECKPGQPGPLPSILQSLSLVREDYQAGGCRMSAWSAWSPCSVSCGRGWTSIHRSVVQHPDPGGRPCPAKLTRRKKCKQAVCSSWTGPWQQNQDN